MLPLARFMRFSRHSRRRQQERKSLFHVPPPSFCEVWVGGKTEFLLATGVGLVIAALLLLNGIYHDRALGKKESVFRKMTHESQGR